MLVCHDFHHDFDENKTNRESRENRESNRFSICPFFHQNHDCLFVFFSFFKILILYFIKTFTKTFN